MGNIITFDSLEDYKSFLDEKATKKRIGEGTEGYCLLSKDKKDVYKNLEKDLILIPADIEYEADKIITTNDIEVSSYIFPDELYAIKNKLIGYKTKYIKEKDLFRIENLENLFKSEIEITEDLFLNAYYQILKDTENLSKEKISIYDLTYNLLYTGKNMYGIDTWGYTRTKEDIFNHNNECLTQAIKEIIYQYFSGYTTYPEEELTKLDKETNIEKYTKKLVKMGQNKSKLLD